MNRRLLIIIAGVVVVLTVVAAVAAVFLRPSAPPAVNANAPAATTTPLTPAGGLPQPGATNTPVTPAPEEETPTFTRASEREILERQLTSTAAQFAERFGTYSNQGDFQNLIDLYPLMTDRLRQATERTIEQARASGTGDGYVGVTTKAVSTELVALDVTAGRATATVSAQRTTQTGDDTPITEYRTLTLDFRRDGSVWLVDAAIWSAP